MLSLKRGFISFFISCFILLLVGCGEHVTENGFSSTSVKIPEPSTDFSVCPQEQVQSSEDFDNPIIDTTLPISYSGTSWQEVYKQILLSDPSSYLMDADVGFNPEDRLLYLGIHDFDSNGFPELIIGDACSAAVFTYVNGEAQKLADLCIPDLVWCINGLYASGNSVSVQCNGAGGSNFVNFGFLDGEFVLGIYTELCSDYAPPVINGEPGTLAQMNQIYPTDYSSFPQEDRKELVRLVHEDDNWVIYSPSRVVLDESFDFEKFLWE